MNLHKRFISPQPSQDPLEFVKALQISQEHSPSKQGSRNNIFKSEKRTEENNLTHRSSRTRYLLNPDESSLQKENTLKSNIMSTKHIARHASATCTVDDDTSDEY